MDGEYIVSDMEVVDIDPNDGKIEVLLIFTSSDHMHYQIVRGYHYKNQEIQPIGEYIMNYEINNLGAFVNQEKKTITVPRNNWGFCSYTSKTEYVLDNGKLKQVEKEDIEMPGYQRRIVATVMAPLNLYEASNSETPVMQLTEGTRLILLITNDTDWVKVKVVVESREGYLRFQIEEGNVVLHNQSETKNKSCCTTSHVGGLTSWQPPIIELFAKNSVIHAQIMSIHTIFWHKSVLYALIKGRFRR